MGEVVEGNDLPEYEKLFSIHLKVLTNLNTLNHRGATIQADF
jgi:hypothetical protein